MKRPRTMEEEVYDYLNYEDGNIVYHDFWYLESLFGKYGHDAVKKEIERQEKKKSN